jgi:hypothetical protein
VNDSDGRLTDAAAAFMRARLDENEPVARAAIDAPAIWQPDEGFCLRDCSGDRIPSAWAEHYAGHDPAAVLDSIDADRELLRAWEEVGNVAQPDTGDDGYAEGISYAIRSRAAAWRKHADYQEAWKP